MTLSEGGGVAQPVVSLVLGGFSGVRRVLLITLLLRPPKGLANLLRLLL